jgi:hypothetical protein
MIVDNHFTRQYNPEDNSEHQKQIWLRGAGRETSRNRFGGQQRKSYNKLIVLEVHSEKK